MPSACGHPLQTRQVIRPLFVTFSLYFGESKLMNDVAVIVGKSFPKETPDILKNERLGSDVADGSHGVRKHVPVIFVALMFAPKRKWLTGGTA